MNTLQVILIAHSTLQGDCHGSANIGGIGQVPGDRATWRDVGQVSDLERDAYQHGCRHIAHNESYYKGGNQGASHAIPA